MNKVTAAMTSAADFVSFITHSYLGPDSPNTAQNFQATLKKAVTAGFGVEKVVLGVTAYAR